MAGFITLLVTALVISSIGWYRFLYFISVGYGAAVTACGAAMLIFYRNTLTVDTVFLCIMLMLYGCRLSGFLLYREFKSSSYKKELPNLTRTSKPVTVPFKLTIWITVALLYVLEVSPVLFRMENLTGHKAQALVRIGKYDATWAWIGFGIMIFAIIIESLADWEKSAAKKIAPKRFCDRGLYRIVRCPNYFGEILFWTGCFISGIDTFNSTAQWLAAIIGYISIVYIMFGGARRLELRQNKNYGDDPEYQKYVNEVPIIIPIVPLYHVHQYTWLKG